MFIALKSIQEQLSSVNVYDVKLIIALQKFAELCECLQYVIRIPYV